MNIIDYYPDTLRDIHDKILDAISGDDITSADAAVAYQVTEWIRSKWGARTLTRKWWGMVGDGVADLRSGTLIEVKGDPVCSLRGRELRAAAWSILALSQHGGRDICQIASMIAVTVEAEWSRTAIYIPQGKEVDRAIRDAAVWRRFNGLSTIDRVIEEFKLSQRQIYDIKKRIQDDKDLREQPSFPGF